MSDLLHNAQDLVERAGSVGRTGSRIDPEEFAALPDALRRHIPAWYVELMTTVPLAGLTFDHGTPDDDGDLRPWSLIWSSAEHMSSESLEAYPGLPVLTHGYFNVALDATGGGDPFFIKNDLSNDPPVWQIYHDVSDDADEILADGLVEVAPRLSALFAEAHVGP